jgi:hypothetical protein
MMLVVVARAVRLVTVPVERSTRQQGHVLERRFQRDRGLYELTLAVIVVHMNLPRGACG